MIKKIKLTSGIRLVLDDIPSLRSVAVGIFVGAGAVKEDKSIAGISHFIEHMMFKGTKNRTAKEIAWDIDKLGAQINAFTSTETTCYYAKAIDTDFEKVSDVLTDMLTSSLLDKEEMDKERNVICEEIKMTLDTPDDLANEKITEHLFEGNNWGNSIIGTPETLKGIDRSKMRDYINRFYTLDNMVISIAGSFDEAEVIKYFEDKFSILGNKADGYRVYEKEYKPSVNIYEKDIEQSHICLATPAIGLDDERKYALNVINSVMGSSMSSRLFQHIREQQGLAYSVYSSLQCYSKAGFYNIYAGVSHDKVYEALAAIKKEIEELRDKGISEEEFDAARTRLKAAHIYGQENVLQRMFYNGKSYILLDKIYETDEIISIYDTMKAEYVNDVREILSAPEKYSMVVVTGKDVNLKENDLWN